MEPSFIKDLRAKWSMPIPPSTAETRSPTTPESFVAKPSDTKTGTDGADVPAGMDPDGFMLMGDDIDWDFWDGLLKDPEYLRPLPDF